MTSGDICNKHCSDVLSSLYKKFRLLNIPVNYTFLFLLEIGDRSIHFLRYNVVQNPSFWSSSQSGDKAFELLTTVFMDRFIEMLVEEISTVLREVASGSFHADESQFS